MHVFAGREVVSSPTIAPMQNASSDSSRRSGVGHAAWGLLAAFLGGLCLAQASGGDREFFLSVGFLLTAVGALGIVIGGVAIGMQVARE